MSDDLVVLLGLTEGEGPSEEFVATLRQQLIGEATDSPTRMTLVDTEPPDVLGSPEHPAQPVARWRLLLVAAAVATVVVGVIIVQQLAGGGAPVETVDETDEESISTTTSVVEPAEIGFVEDAEKLILTSTRLSPGTYRVDNLGTPFSFTSERELAVRNNVSGFFGISSLNATGPGDQDIRIIPVTEFSDPSRPGETFLLGQGWPNSDFAGWLDNAPDMVQISNRETTTLGGLPAVRVDLTLNKTVIDPSSCYSGSGACLTVATDRLVTSIELDHGMQTRLWIVDRGEDKDPLAIAANIDHPYNEPWLEFADEFLATLAFQQPSAADPDGG